MKNKYLLLCLTLVFSIGCLTSCREDVDVMGTSKDLAQKTIVGTSGFRCGYQIDGLSMDVVQYQFLPGNKLQRTVLAWGNLSAVTTQTKQYSYAMGEFGPNGVGINVSCTPDDNADSPFSFFFLNNVLEESGLNLAYPLTEQNDKVSAILAIDTLFSDVNCTFDKTTFWINEVSYNDTIFNRKLILVGNQPAIVIDTLVYKRQRLDTLGVQSVTHCDYTFKRNSSTYANTGIYNFSYKTWEKDGKVAIDSLVNCDFNWGLSNVTSAQKFNVLVVPTSMQYSNWTVGISKFNLSKQTIAIDGENYELQPKE